MGTVVSKQVKIGLIVGAVVLLLAAGTATFLVLWLKHKHNEHKRTTQSGASCKGKCPAGLYCDSVNHTCEVNACATPVATQHELGKSGNPVYPFLIQHKNSGNCMQIGSAVTGDAILSRAASSYSTTYDEIVLAPCDYSNSAQFWAMESVDTNGVDNVVFKSMSRESGYISAKIIEYTNTPNTPPDSVRPVTITEKISKGYAANTSANFMDYGVLEYDFGLSNMPRDITDKNGFVIVDSQNMYDWWATKGLLGRTGYVYGVVATNNTTLRWTKVSVDNTTNNVIPSASDPITITGADVFQILPVVSNVVCEK